VFGVREKDFQSRENEKNEIWFAPQQYIEIAAQWIEVSINIFRALNLDRNEFVEVLSRIYQRQNHLDGSRIYWEFIDQTESSKIWLDGSKKLSRFYREETQKSQWIKNPSRSVEKRRKKGSI